MPGNLSDFNVDAFFVNLRDAFSGLMTWTWDERYSTVVGEFKRNDAEQVIDTLECHFSAMWDSAVIGSATEVEQEVNRQLGGIEPGQALYTTDPCYGVIVFCAWWRWSHGQRFSLRVGTSSLLLGSKTDPGAVARLRAIFGVDKMASPS